MESENSIAITHFINPHLFWYKTIEVPGTELHVLASFEQSLSELYKNKPVCDNLFRPQKGDKVAVNFIAWNKFIRAEILQKAEYQKEEYIVWALDYGFPLLTKKEYLRNLPTNLKADIGYIRVGGIANIYPAEQEYDDMEGNLVMVKKDKWLQKTCNMLEKLLADANSVSFFKQFQTENGHVWGDLIILNHKGIQINARELLLKTTNAVEENNLTFKTNCSKFKSTKIAPWLSNDRNTKLKYNNIKHNYIEYSKQMNAVLVDENAKRKVEDWQERNERKNIEAVPETFETSCELSEDNIDDVTFDDSVSVANNQINYMGKAGILTKIKQQKYSSEKKLPPSALPKCFEFDAMISKLQCPKESPQFFSSLSTASSNISTPAEKQPELSTKLEANSDILNEDLNSGAYLFDINNSNGCLIDLQSNSSLSKVSSVKMRQKNLLEMRLKIARAEKERKINKQAVSQQISNHNETYTSTSTQSKTLESYPYRLLEQSLTTSTANNTASNYEQDKKSELSVKNIRVKHLMAMRKKFAPSSILSSTDCTQINNTSDSVVSSNTSSSKTETMVDNGNKNNMKSINNLSFRLEPKIIKNTEDKIEQLPNTYSVNLPSKNEIKESLKLSKSGYDSFTMVPAGFDITRLQTYKDEVNHWHRKKSTRNDYVPHENSSSTDELLSNNAHDQSFSSSDISQTKSLKGFSQNSNNQKDKLFPLNNKTFNISKIGPDSQFGTCSQQRDSNIQSEIKNTSENNLSNELSTSSNSSVLSLRQRKKRELKPPGSQLLKINKILWEHCMEKEMGNSNILDLQRLNTSSSSNKNIATVDNYIVKDSSTHSSSSADNIQNEKVYKDDLNYEELMVVKHTETLPIVEGERKIQMKYIDHLVLAHSSIQLTPIENILEAPFLPEIHEELRQMRVNKVFRIQVYSWTHVCRNNSLFVVNPSRSGKTLSYLPSLCSLICCRKDTLKPSYGPVAIILVASLKHVELVSRYCTRLMSGFKNEAPTCVPSFGLRNLMKTKIQLLNGCGILVATPSNVLRLLQENEHEPLFDADRLQHIVIDDMDIMMSRSQEDFEKAYKILFKMAKKSEFKKLLPQLIVTSRDWDGLMVKFIRKSNQPLLLIGDFLEAAVYGHATLSVKLKSNNKKNDSILKFLKEISESTQNTDNRTLIICNEDEDVQNVYKFLQECGYSCLSFFSRSTETEEITVDEWNKKVSSQILVCTDSRFCELKIQNVNNLIHYSMPTSWTQFTFRFSALARTYKNFVSQFENSTLSTAYNAYKMNNAYSMILLDEYNSLQLPRLVDFMRKHNQKVQDEIQAVSKRVLIMREEQRILNNLCPQLLEFGECDEPRCDFRHELTRLDAIKKSDNIPSSGEIRLHVLKVFSPTYYIVRLIHHKPPNTVKWNEIRRSSEALKFSIQLNRFYSDENNLSLHWPPRINDMCIYQYTENYRRALILEAPTFQQKETNIVQSHLKVTLKLIDEGSVISSVKCNEIFLCDEKFKDFPPQAVDVRLLKVVPFDNERTWDHKTTKQVQKWIIDDIKSNYVVQASIDFAFANTIWVKNLVVMEKLSGIYAYCQIVNLKKSLVEKNFGVLYNGERKQVRDLVEQFDLLSSSQIDVDTGDSDLDYQSCQNESEDLIKFSSSNDEAVNSSMESAKAGVKDEKIIDLLKISKETKTADKDGKIHKSDEENWDCLDNGEEAYDPYHISSFDKVVNTKEESWTKLNLNELVKVEIGDEGENGNWENIFLQTIDKNSMSLFDQLNKLIVEHVEKVKSKKENQQKIYDFKPLHNCLVKYNNLYLRAKVYGIYGENAQRLYRFFLCDYACFTNAKAEELYNDFLYETTEEIVTFTPYQAVHCTLAGIKWDHFTKRYQVTKDYLYACAVVESVSDQNLQNLPIRSYKILMYECENENEFQNASLFNKTLMDKGITVCDEETKNFLEYEIGNPEREEQSPNKANDKEENLVDIPKSYNNDKVFNFEELLEFIKSDAFDIDVNDILKNVQQPETKNLNNNAIEHVSESARITSNVTFDKKTMFKEESKVPTSDSETEEQGHCTSISNSSIKSSISLNSTDVSNCSATESFLPPLPPLKALYKRPLTMWYQNDCMIFISINAPDIEDYLLEVTSKTLFFVAEIQSEKSVLILNFLGSVDLKSVSHEIKGLNVIIRLKKNYFIKWPRLLQQSTKYSWLKYNFDGFDSDEMEYIEPQQVLHNILDNEFNNQNKKIESYNSDEDSERELYQTYNPIQDNDDDYDPFS